MGLTASQEANTIIANYEDLNSIIMVIAKLQQKMNQRNILLTFDSLTTLYLLNKGEVLRFMRPSLMRFTSEGNSLVDLTDEGCCKSVELLSIISIADGVIKVEMGEH